MGDGNARTPPPQSPPPRGRRRAEQCHAARRNDGHRLRQVRSGAARQPSFVVDIPADHMKGRNFAEPGDHLGFADIAGVDNQVRPAKRIEGLRPQQAMRIRDDADNELARGHLRRPVGIWMRHGGGKVDYAPDMQERNLSRPIGDQHRPSFQRGHWRRHGPPGLPLIIAIGDIVNTCARLGNLPRPMIAQFSCPMSSPRPRCLASPDPCGATTCRQASHPG